ncbi:hypothetical protein FB451DRAFT_1380540 [Mycena latifolia]|nr:hypothetical protein FB451DRAFT_1380540 [Mycena latifolia]
MTILDGNGPKYSLLHTRESTTAFWGQPCWPPSRDMRAPCYQSRIVHRTFHYYILHSQSRIFWRSCEHLGMDLGLQNTRSSHNPNFGVPHWSEADFLTFRMPHICTKTM